jgi:YD repeat-containing protein
VNARTTGSTWYLGIFNPVNTLNYTYDGNNNLLTAGDMNGTYTFTYDSLDRVKSQKDMHGVTLTFTYDNAGLRLGEVCRLQVADIDSRRMVIQFARRRATRSA